MKESSLKQAKPIAAYDHVREQLFKIFTADMFGDPNATGAAILKVVDAELEAVFFGTGVCLCRAPSESTYGNTRSTPTP
jgi:hypothetical protein